MLNRKPKTKKVNESARIKSTRTPRFILFVGDEGAILVHLQGNKVLKRLFAPTPEPAATKAFTELLASEPGAPLYMMVDMIDQSYVRHDLPPVSSMSVNKLIKRRLDRDFGPEDIKGAIRLGRDTAGRKDWNYLLVSLASTPLFAQWLTLAYEAPNRFKGVYLVPIEAQTLIGQLAQVMKKEKAVEPSGWQILVSHNKVGGFRQVVLRNGKLVFTRLAQPVGETTAEVIAGNIEQEMLGTMEYIKRLSYTEQEGLDLFIIVSQEIKNALDVTKFKVSNAEIYTPYEVATKLNIDQAALPGDHFGDVLLAASFGAAKKHQLKLSTPHSQKQDMLYGLEGGVKGLGYIAGVGMILYMLSLGYDMYIASTADSQILSDQKIATLNLAKVREEAKQLPEDVEKIITTLDLYDVFTKDDYAPFDMIAAVSGVLSDTVLLDSFKWRAGVAAGGAAPTDAANAAAKPAGPVVSELTVKFYSDTESIERFIAASNDFIANLRRAVPGYTLIASKLPGTVGETETLQMTFDEKASASQSGFEPGKPTTVTISLSGPAVVDAAAGGATGAMPPSAMPAAAGAVR